MNSPASLPPTRITVATPDSEAVRLLLGHLDETRRLIERELPVSIALRGEALIVTGNPSATPT
ncbi:MAG TPA: hypothetical protein VNA16_01855, partial [Abditibacteriaceae bacterium]|nr:hypothetical protein [Abditibacteriaceae bacterium]